MASKITKLMSLIENLPEWFLNVIKQHLQFKDAANNVYREIDGSDNNQHYEQSGANFLRVAPDATVTDFSTPSGGSRPSAREISNELFAQDNDIVSPQGVSDWFWAWGQFVDHDIDLTGAAPIAEHFNIEVPEGDAYFDPRGSGMMTIEMTRSGYDPGTGTDTMREQINEITPFLDGSVVYGSDEIRNEALRDDGGYMKTSAGNLLPFNEDGLENAPSHASYLFLAGDVRGNENIALTSIHTLFVREHNRLVDELQQSRPEYDAEMLYQEAKMIVEAQLQAVTYHDFLPLLVGDNALAEYDGFDADVKPQIMNVFATAAYRFGHSMLSETLYRMNEDGSESAEGHTALRDAFFNPMALGSVDTLYRGLASNEAQAIDLAIVDDVRNFLFGPPGSGGFDLASLNIQRGRDHNLGDYNTVRETFGLDKAEDFADISSDIGIQTKLAKLYDSVDDIDVFVGGLAEDAATESMLGDLFTKIIVQQFSNIRNGDQYWYEGRLEAPLVKEIQNTKLSDIIMRNSDVEFIQENVFMAYNRLGGSDHKDKLHGGKENDLIIGFDGNDKLYGHKGDDELHGGNGRDLLKGGLGDDLLNGGHGNDKLKGGQGKDIFQFELASGRDKIYDFEDGDLIDLSARDLSFEQISIIQKANGSKIKLDGGDSLYLLGVDSDDIDQSDFLF